MVITISDQNANVILTQPGDTASGEHQFIWDGKDGLGIQQPDGPYTVSVTAVGSDQQIIPVTVVTKGRVTGVSTDNGLTVLDMSGAGVPLEKVLSVNEPESPGGGGI